jgi:DNA-binding NtrC family response regulator
MSTVSPETAVVPLTAYATVETAVEAFQKGAADYLMKPVILAEVGDKLRRLVRQRELIAENAALRRELHRREPGGDLIVGRSPLLRRAVAVAEKAARSPSTVLILGESGTGKELMARLVHRAAQEWKPTDGRFLAVNCAALPADLVENQLFGHAKGAFTGADKAAPGVFQHAGAGTVFLDEIGDLPLAAQAKLLRAIEAKEVFPVGANEPVTVAARVVAATNKDLAAEADAGRFRPDLFYRLNVVSVTLPPLRDRREDIPDLAAGLLARHSAAAGKRFTGVAHDAMKLLLAHPWKGNVRELDNALQRAVVLGDGPLVQAADLPSAVGGGPPDPFAVDDLNAAAERFERLHLERMLRLYPDKKEAARRLGIGLSSLYRKIEQHGLADRDG